MGGADHDVVVVGAGLAGLAAAVVLLEQGLDVLVLEREDVVGGRQRTDEVDGFLLDRGFQVLNPAYPALRAHVDLGALDLQPFGAGVLVRRTHGLACLAHPLRHPALLPRTLTSGLLRPGEVAALARWAGAAVVAPRSVLAAGDATLAAGWERAGVDGPLRREVLEPFLAGVLADDRLETSEGFVRLLVRMFLLGRPGLPARGMRALPEQLAGRVSALGGSVRTGVAVAALEDSGRGATVRLGDGGRVTARAAVLAVGPEALPGLAGGPSLPTRGLTTWWFAADEPPSGSAMVAVDGTRSGPLVNSAVVSNAAPSYAPTGRHLVEATALLRPGVRVTDDEARGHAARVWGAATGSWELLARHDVPDALPVQSAPLRTTSPARLRTGLYACGDHRDTASIQGALVSGRRVARAVLADLSGAAGPAA